MDDFITLLIGWGLGSLVEFFVQPVYGWWMGVDWPFFAKMHSVFHPVRPWYVPLRDSILQTGYYVDLKDIFKNDLLAKLASEVARIFSWLAPDTTGSPFGGTGDEVPKLAYGIDSVTLFEKLFKETGAANAGFFHTHPVGMKSLSTFRRMTTPSNPIFNTLVPHVGTHTGFWDNDGEQGRVAFYFSPLCPYLPLEPEYWPTDVLSDILEANSHVIKGIIWTLGLMSVAALAHGMATTDWFEEAAGGGVSSGARSLTYNYVNLITSWCGKTFISVVGTAAKSRPPMPHLLKKILQKVGVYKQIYWLIKHFTPMSISSWVETFPVQPFNPADIYLEISGVSSRIWGTPKPLSLGQTGTQVNSLWLLNDTLAALVFASSSRMIAEHPSVLSCPGKSSFITQTICQEESTHFMTQVLWFPSPLSSIVTEDDAGTVVLACPTQANEDGVKVALSRWAPRIVPVSFAGSWAEFAEVYDKIWDNIDDVIDDAFDTIRDVLENNKNAPYRASMCAAAFSISCHKTAMKHAIPSFDEIVSTITEGRCLDLITDGIARIGAYLTLFISFYLGGGPPGIALFWWSPQFNPPIWVSRSPKLCAMDPISIGKGIIELIMSLPSYFHEKYEDAIHMLENMLRRYIGRIMGT